MNLFFRFAVVFLAIAGAVALSIGPAGLQFGTANYWDHHGFAYLFFLAVFPRLTLLYALFVGGAVWGGVVGWLGWIFAPRLLVAVLATLEYWHANPLLVVIAWLIAIGGESGEKTYVRRRRVRARR